MKYRLTCVSSYIELYEIDADSVEEAERMYLEGEVEPIRSDDNTSEIISVEETQ